MITGNGPTLLPTALAATAGALGRLVPRVVLAWWVDLTRNSQASRPQPGLVREGPTLQNTFTLRGATAGFASWDRGAWDSAGATGGRQH